MSSYLSLSSVSPSKLKTVVERLCCTNFKCVTVCSVKSTRIETPFAFACQRDRNRWFRIVPSTKRKPVVGWEVGTTDDENAFLLCCAIEKKKKNNIYFLRFFFGCLLLLLYLFIIVLYYYCFLFCFLSSSRSRRRSSNTASGTELQ